MAYLSKYGVARKIRIPLVRRGVVDHAVSADWTPAAGDVKISKDGGATANVTNLPTAIAMGNSTIWEFSLTATEMQAAQINITIADSATKVIEDSGFDIETYGNASAQHAVDLADSVRAGLTALPNATAGANGGVPALDSNLEVKASTLRTNNDKTGYSLSSAGVQAIWDALTSALTTVGSIGKRLVDNIDAAISSRSTYAGGAVASVTAGVTVTTNNDKTGYSLSAGGIQAIWDALTSALTTVGSVGKVIADYLKGDIYNRLGAPSGASISADIAAVKTDTGTASTNSTTILSRIGSFTGSGLNTILGFLRAIARKDAALTPSDMGGTFDNTTDSLEAVKDTGIASVTSVTNAVAVTSNIKKNQALSGFTFVMIDTSDHVSGKTELTVTAQRSIDGGAFSNCANTVSEIGSGAYKIDLAASDLKGNAVLFKFSATGADTRFVEVVTQP